MSGSNSKITIIEGHDLELLMSAIGFTVGITTSTHRLRIWPQPNGSVKIKVNEGTWTYLIGKADV